MSDEIAKNWNDWLTVRCVKSRVKWKVSRLNCKPNKLIIVLRITCDRIGNSSKSVTHWLFFFLLVRIWWEFEYRYLKFPTQTAKILLSSMHRFLKLIMANWKYTPMWLNYDIQIMNFSLGGFLMAIPSTTLSLTTKHFKITSGVQV